VASIDALVTHALFDETTTRHLHRAGIDHIWSTDSIPHPSNSLNLNRLLASAIRE
jgi:ribose-phosphate pyrophosphokinase